MWISASRSATTSKLQNRASVYHGVTLEDGVFVGPHVVFTNDRRPRAINPDGTLKSDARLGRGRHARRYGAAVGAGAIVLPDVRIGRFAMVGAGALVTHDVPDYGLALGAPARRGGLCLLLWRAPARRAPRPALRSPVPPAAPRPRWSPRNERPPLRAAVIGVGAMGRNHCRVYHDLPDVELVAVADADPATAERVGRSFGVAVFTDPVALLETARPDLVSIAAPTMEHLPVALATIAHGVHLLVEKPLAFTVAEGRQIIAAAHAAGVTLAVGHVERYNPALTELKARLTAGALGRVFQMHAQRLGPFPARVRDVGVVVDLATHDVDIMRYLSGAEVTRVYAETARRIHTEHEDLLSGLLRFSDGTIGVLDINWLTPTKIRQLTVTGEQGMFQVNYLTQDLYFYENDYAVAAGTTSAALTGVSEGDDDPPAPRPRRTAAPRARGLRGRGARRGRRDRLGRGRPQGGRDHPADCGGGAGEPYRPARRSRRRAAP